VGTITEIVATI